MKILVVGGAGFIGHNVALKLEEQGHQVVILDNMSTYGLTNRTEHTELVEHRLSKFHGRIYTYNIAEFGDVRHVYKAFHPEVVIHLGSFPRAKIVNKDPVMARYTMIDGVENLLNCARDSVRRFIYISSSMIYGDFDGGIGEDAAPKPGSIYASYKLSGELLTKYFADKYGFEYTIVRPSAVYGPKDVEDRVVAKFFMNALRGNPLCVHGVEERLDFSYVDDVANGIVLAALHPNAADETFNMTYGEDETIHDAAVKIARLVLPVGKGIIKIEPPNPLMPSRGYLDISKAKRLLNYNPQYDIDRGFKEYYAWIRDWYEHRS